MDVLISLILALSSSPALLPATPAQSKANATVALSSSPTLLPATPAQSKQSYPTQGEVNESYQLSPNANIEVRGIEGGVKVETTADNRAQIHWVRHARTQRDYDCEKIVIEQSPSSLIVRHETNRSCRVILAWEEMTLVVPRSANLTLAQLEGSVTVGDTDGYLQLTNIEGSVRGTVRAARITNVEGDLSLHVAGLNSPGITVRNVEGDVELRMAENVNANLSVRRATRVDIDLPNAPNKRISNNAFQSEYEDDARRSITDLQLGSGGAAISISQIEGRVRVRGE